jgi:predicted nucleic acid-binding Zn finger protein
MALSLSDMVLGLLTTVSSLVVENASDNKQQQISLTGDVKVAVEGQQVAGNKDVFRGEKAQMGRSAEGIGSPPQQVSATQKNSELAARGNHSSAKADSKNLSSQNQVPSFAGGHSSEATHRVPLQTEIIVGQPTEGQRHGSSRHSSSSTSSSRDGSAGVSSSPVSGASHGMRGGEGSSGGVSLGGSARTAGATYESEGSPSSIESKVRSGSTSPLTPSAARSALEALTKGMDHPSFEGPKMSDPSKSLESTPQIKTPQPKSVDKSTVKEPTVKELVADKSVPAEGSKTVEKQVNNDRESSLSHAPMLQSAPKQAISRNDLLSQQPSVIQSPERESGVIATAHNLESRESVQKSAPPPPSKVDNGEGAKKGPPPPKGAPKPGVVKPEPPLKAGNASKAVDKKVAPPAAHSIVSEAKTPQKALAPAAKAGNDGTVKTASTPSSSPVKGAGSNAEVQHAAQALGFDLNKSYKDLGEATQALTAMVKRKSYTLQNKLEGILEKHLENISEDADLEQILAQDSEYTKASAEIKAIDAYQEQVKEALMKKHARTVELDEKDVQAAKALGFDLNASYKDLGEATQALTAMVKRKSYTLQNKLEGILEKYLENISEDADLEQILAQDSEYTKASAEIKAIDAYQEQVKEVLTKKHAAAGKKKAKKSSSGGATDFLAELLLLNGENQPAAQQLTPQELKKEIHELGMKVRAVEAQAAAIYAVDSARGAELSREVKEMKELKLQREAELNKLQQAQEASTNNVQRTVSRRGPTPEQLEKQAEELQKFTFSYPKTTPFLDLLEPNEKMNFMKGKINVEYLANKFYQEKEGQKKPEKVQTKQLSIVSAISLLTPEQQEELLENIGNLKETNPNALSKARLASLRHIKNYLNLDGFKVPNWTEDLERGLAGPAVVVKTPDKIVAEPAKDLKEEEDKKKASSQSTRELEVLTGDKDKMNKAASKLNVDLLKGPSKRVLQSRGVLPRDSDDDTK